MGRLNNAPHLKIMAFNPNPKVEMARDFARKFNCDQVVILFLDNKNGQMGFASYGETKILCDDAKKIGDVAFDAVSEAINKGEL